MMRRLLMIGACALAVSACATTPSPHPDSASVIPPMAWQAAASGDHAVEPGWWRAFGDPALTAAVDAALVRNIDLAVAEARVREAEALADQARAGLFPTLDGSGGAQQARTLSALGQPSEAATGQVQLQVAYEVDLWGRVRNADAAARASLQASEFGRDARALSVASATARAYVTLLSLDAQLEIARSTLTSRDEALRLATRRADAGQTSRLELTQAESEQRAAARQIPALELAIRRQENALRLLIGDMPGRVERGRLEELVLPAPSPGLPSALLARRPDVAQAEAQLIATDASFASAQAALLPQVRLTGSLGELLVESLDPTTVWSLGGSILAPLFDGGRLAAGAEAAEARRDQAAFSYRGVVLGAFSEVENALEGVTRLERQAEEAQAQWVALENALFHARNRYRAGYASYLEELDAQRGLFNVELSLVQLQESRLLNAVALYQALGGGWTEQLPAS
ncbi:RND transporter [Brevundimonas diminuta]|nr:RND transporter [Brevundimonas diminuta]